MATRRDTREWIVQLLYEMDMRNVEDIPKIFDAFWADRKASAKSRAFVEDSVMAVREHIQEIDRTIEAHAKNWDLNRMGVVDRNVMRMAVSEMLYRKDIPPAVSINEAVDIAKYFSHRESGRFVNGILDKIRAGIGRDPRDKE